VIFGLIIGLSKYFFLDSINTQTSQVSRNLNSLKDKILEICIFVIWLVFGLFLLPHKLFNNFLKLLSLAPLWYSESNYELKDVPVSENFDRFFSEKVINIGDIPSQKIQGVRMIMLYRLRDIYHANLIFPIKKIVLA
jgi:hypothetical protein